MSDVEIKVVKVPSLMAYLGILTKAYLDEQVTRAEFFHRTRIIGDTWRYYENRPDSEGA